MNPMLGLGLTLASDAITLGDLSRAADVARATVTACEREPRSCANPDTRHGLARAFAVLHSESTVVFGTQEPALAAAAHLLAPNQANQWLGPPTDAAPPEWVHLVVAKKKPRAVVQKPVWQPTDQGIAVSYREVDLRHRAPTRVLQIRDTPVEMSALVRDKRLEALAMANDLLGQHGRSAPLLLRVAGLYDEEAQVQHLLELEAAQRALDACDEDWCEGADIEPNHFASKRWRERALVLYTEIEERHPRFEELDSVLFRRGLAHLDEGDAPQALAAFVRLVRRHPRSEYASDAWLQIAEFNYDAGRVAEAMKAYERAQRHVDPERMVFAHYMHAWCLYNLGAFDRAFARMEKVALLADGPSVDAYYSDLALFAAEADKVERLASILEEAGHPHLLAPALDRAGERLAEQGRITEAVATWRRVVRLDPAVGRAAQQRIVALALKSASSAGLFQELTAMVRDVSLDPSVRAGQDGDALEGLLRQAQVRFHQECRDQKLPSCGFADVAYVAHLGLSPEPSLAADLHYEAGELTYLRGEYAKAFRHYRAVVALDPTHAKAPFCAESAIHAAERALSIREPAVGVGPRTLLAEEQWLLTALEGLAASFPQHDQAAEALFRAGELVFQVGGRQRSEALFGQLIDRYPEHPATPAAIERLLHSLAQREAWTELYDTARQLAASPVLRAAASDDLELVTAKATLKMAEELAAVVGNEREAAQAFMEFVQNWPTSPLAAKALNNAVYYYEKTGLHELAAHSRGRLVEHYPSSTYTPDHLAALAVRAEGRGEFAVAAVYFERLVQTFPDHPSASDALYSAALFRWALGDWQRAVAHYDVFVELWPNESRTPGIRFDKLRLLEEAEAHASAVVQARSLLTVDDPVRAMYAHLALARNLEALGLDEASGAWAAADAFGEGSDHIEVRSQLAGLRLQRAQDALHRIVSVQADVVDEQQAGLALRTKLQALAQLEETVLSVVATGDAQGAQSAWVLLGEAYEDLAGAMRTSPIPRSLDEDQRVVYWANVLDQVWTFEERAVEAYSRVIDVAEVHEAFGAASQLALESRHRLRPDAFEGLPTEKLKAARFVQASSGLPLETSLQ